MRDTLRRLFVAFLLLLNQCATTHADIFEDEPQHCEETCTEDPAGRIEDIDGTKWKEGADGTYRSEDGKKCKWSEALGEWICED